MKNPNESPPPQSAMRSAENEQHAAAPLPGSGMARGGDQTLQRAGGSVHGWIPDAFNLKTAVDRLSP
jgi:hypothetical protein